MKSSDGNETYEDGEISEEEIPMPVKGHAVAKKNDKVTKDGMENEDDEEEECEEEYDVLYEDEDKNLISKEKEFSNGDANSAVGDEEYNSDEVSDNDDVPAATSTGTIKKSTAPVVAKTAVSKKPKRQSFQVMVESAIIHLSERGGSSTRAIKKYMLANYSDLNEVRVERQIWKYIKTAVQAGRVLQVKRKFKLSSGAKIENVTQLQLKLKKNTAPDKDRGPIQSKSGPTDVKVKAKVPAGPAKAKAVAVKKASKIVPKVGEKQPTMKKAAKTEVGPKPPISAKPVSKKGQASKTDTKNLNPKKDTNNNAKPPPKTIEPKTSKIEREVKKNKSPQKSSMAVGSSVDKVKNARKGKEKDKVNASASGKTDTTSKKIAAKLPKKKIK